MPCLATFHSNAVSLHVRGDRAACANDGAGADADRSDKRRIRSDESALANQCPVFAKPVIIAGDRARAHIRPCANLGIPEIGQVTGLCAVTETGLLNLDKIADLDAVGSFGAGAKPRIRADYAAGAEARALEMRKGVDDAALADMASGAAPHAVR